MAWQASLGFALVLLSLGGPAAAEDNGWEYTITPYLWAPGITTSVETAQGTLEAEASIGDVVSATDFAVMTVFEARNGRWGLIGDLVYTDLTERKNAPLGGLFSRATLESELTLASGYVAYRFHDDTRVAVDLLGGFRAVDADVQVRLAPGVLPGQSFQAGETWVDPILGGRIQVALSDRWSATAMADFGGVGGGSDRTWQAFAVVRYQIGERWSVQGGWRQLSIKKEMDGRDVELDLGGPVIGATFRF